MIIQGYKIAENEKVLLPVNAIIGTADKKYEITYDYCKGCGICANECKKGAITMVPEGGAK